MVKDENPGMDLLMHWDWHKSALALAERMGSETGNEHLVSEDVKIIDLPPLAAGDTEAGGGEKANAETTAIQQSTDGDSSDSSPTDTSKLQTTATTVTSTGDTPTTETSTPGTTPAATPVAPGAPTPASYAQQISRKLFWAGLAFCGLAALAGFYVVRRYGKA